MAEDRKGEPRAAIEADEVVELDGDAAGSLDEAVREALAAVERGANEGGAEVGSGAPAAAPEREVEELREKWLRALADLENYRKRTQRDRLEEQRYRGFEVLRGLIPIVDNLGRALTSEGSVTDLKQGVEMILRQLEALLRDHGVERIEAEGRPFDPSLHEAVAHHQDTEVAEPTVTLELQPGYRMRGRLLRAAAVRVATPAAETGRSEDEE